MSPPTPHQQQQPAALTVDAGCPSVLDLEPLRPLLHQLADLIAERLAQRLASQQPTVRELPSRRLITLEELVALLPSGKRPGTWKGWLYQRTRLHGEVPGQHKLGGRLFFDPDHTLPWLLNHAPAGPEKPGLDVGAEQSLHARSMPQQPAPGRDEGRDR